MRPLIAAPLLIASPALAAEPPQTPDVKPPEVQYKAVTDVVIDGVRVDAGVHRPTGVHSWERRRSTFNPLAKLRTNFDAELVDSVAQVR